MVTGKTIEPFISQTVFALVGVSRNNKKFGYAAYSGLKKRGYKVYPVNKNAEFIDGDKCYSNISRIPEKVNAVIISVSPAETLSLVKEAYSNNIKNIWLQRGSETDEAIDFCVKNDINLVYKECILMFARPDSVHKIHWWINKIFRRLPA